LSAEPRWATHRAIVEQDQLQRAPALPVLAAVTSALDIAIAVLRIQHPFVGGGTRFDHLREPVPVVLAEIVRLHAVALRSAIENYREVMTPDLDAPDNDLDDF
jgi:hypothetical protein